MKNQEVSILSVLLSHKDQELSINHIAKLMHKDYKTTHTIIRRLAKIPVIKLEPLGKSLRVKPLNTIHPLLFEAEYLRKQELLQDKNIAILQESFCKIPSKLYILLLFGSYAKKTYTKQSDIDLMFIVPSGNEDKMERDIRSIANTLPLKIHLNIFTENDFMAMNKSKEITVGSEAIQNNIILHGVEAYYEMIR